MTEREAIEIISRPFSMQEVPKEILDAHRLAISALEKQEQERWIPVTERLPETSGLYTVTDMTGDVVRYIFTGTDSSKRYWKRNAKAWRPLPEGYKAEGEV